MRWDGRYCERCPMFPTINVKETKSEDLELWATGRSASEKEKTQTISRLSLSFCFMRKMGLEELTISESIEKRRVSTHRFACNPVCNPNSKQI